MFIVDRLERDAWATIRGYFYQANISILDWIKLKDDQSIDLEHGEDLDIITFPSKKRELIQIKHIDGSITLRNKEVFEAILNFIYHLKANSFTIEHLSFVFCTNAHIGTERGSRFQVSKHDSTKGLEVWKNIYNNKLSLSNEKSAIKEILLILKEKLKEKNECESEKWGQVHDYLKNVTEVDFGKVIKKFSLRIDEVDFDESGKAITKTLEDHGFGNCENDYEKVYYHLLYYILKKLSIKGPKKLNMKDLHQQIFTAAQRDIDSIKFKLTEFIESRQQTIIDEMETKKIQYLTSVLSEIDTIVMEDDIDSAEDTLVRYILPNAARSDQTLYTEAKRILININDNKTKNLSRKEFITETKTLFTDYKEQVNSTLNKLLHQNSL
ncbi:hypothetical protein [Peribacillus sp. NPDC101480]|uniref:hypothetical protein n=1 Tax=Peribacillus sp. NPDC101480 TaxID=3390620 RepID=UPI003D0628FB